MNKNQGVVLLLLKLKTSQLAHEGTYCISSWVATILGDSGAVSQAGRKGTMKVFKHGRKSAWVKNLNKPFPNGQANAGSWLDTKNALYYFAQLANSIYWVLFVCSYTMAIVSPYLSGSSTKKCYLGSFQFDINSSFQNTISLVLGLWGWVVTGISIVNGLSIMRAWAVC